MVPRRRTLTSMRRACLLGCAPVFAVAILLLVKRRAAHLVGDVSIQVHTATKGHAEPECTNGWTRGVKRKVFDVFPINTEIDVLMVRLHELNSTVDRFVILEAPYTFSGLSKPLHFKNAEPPPTPVRVTEALQAAVLVH